MIKTIPKHLYQIFKNGSKTYFYSSLFFPNDVKTDVFILYGFVRTADDYVDQTPPQTIQFKQFRLDYEQALAGKITGKLVIDKFVELQKRRGFDVQWVRSFLDAMERDLTQKTYPNMVDTLSYIHGSAEVIGLMMSKILDLPTQAYQTAQRLGRSMQYVNFIRDIQEDNELGRIYFPQDQLRKYHLVSLERQVVEKNISHFRQFIQTQIALYKQWDSEGREGYKYIPHRYLIPIKTANDLYQWTLDEIAKRPIVIFERKVKPSVPRIILTLLKNAILVLCR